MKVFELASRGVFSMEGNQALVRAAVMVVDKVFFAEGHRVCCYIKVTGWSKSNVVEQHVLFDAQSVKDDYGKVHTAEDLAKWIAAQLTAEYHEFQRHQPKAA